MKLKDLLASVAPAKRNEAIWLLSGLFGMSRSEILLDPERTLRPAQLRKWSSAWRRRRSGEPLQYICGSAPFWGRDFAVRPGVLIPRPETERLVELGLGLLADKRVARVIDVGTGSGIIAITLKLERPDWDVTATDIDKRALRQAEANAAHFGAKLSFVQADALAGLFLECSRADLVISNPPYLNFAKDRVGGEVREFEPELALQPREEKRVEGVAERGAWIAERILRQCAHARPRFTALELSPRVASLLERKWRKHTAVERVWREADLAGRKRFLLIAWKNA